MGVRPMRPGVNIVSKLLLLVLIGVLVYVVYRSANRVGRGGAPAQPKQAEDMVRCVHCGVNLPRSEALLSQGAFFCGDEHRRLHQA